jgi:hypothetical protein
LERVGLRQAQPPKNDCRLSLSKAGFEGGFDKLSQRGNGRSLSLSMAKLRLCFVDRPDSGGGTFSYTHQTAMTAMHVNKWRFIPVNANDGLDRTYLFGQTALAVQA